ncbi:unnamed protein product [Brassica rapa subsp. trilocularis]
MLLLEAKAVETATAVLERPDSKSDRFYCTVIVKFIFFGTCK